MQVRFAPVDASYIKSLVAQGFYTTENEVVRDAVRRMREAEKRLELLRAAILVGDRQIEAGEVVSYSDALLDQIEQRAIAKAEQRMKVGNPDVV